MTAELRYLSGKGYVDLYNADMFALELTIRDLEKLHESLLASNRLPMESLTHKIPDHRIMFFKTLNKHDKRALASANSLRLVTRHFPPELGLTETQALPLLPNL